MPEHVSTYFCVLLRLWRVQHQGEWVWQGTLENVHTHQRENFHGLGELFDLLELDAHAATTQDPAQP